MKYFCSKLFTFLFILLGLQALIHPLFIDDIPREIVQLNKILNSSTQIIGLGDSTIDYDLPYDLNAKHTYDFLQDKLPQHHIESLISWSYHLDMFFSVSQYIAQNDYPPKAVIIPINLRNFSPDWHGKPEYEFEKHKALLTNNYPLFYVFYKPLGIFKQFRRRISEVDFLNTPVFKGDLYLGKVKDFTGPKYKIYTNQHFLNKILVRYMLPIPENHPKFQSIINCAKILIKANIKPVFYVSPIDYQTGEKYFEDEFTKIIDENINLIKEHLKKHNVEILDLSRSLPRNEFIWKYDESGGFYVNEHITKSGKMLVAEQLAKFIKDINL